MGAGSNSGGAGRCPCPTAWGHWDDVDTVSAGAGLVRGFCHQVVEHFHLPFAEADSHNDSVPNCWLRHPSLISCVPESATPGEEEDPDAGSG